MITGKGEYYEAVVKDVDPTKKDLVCCFPADSGMDEACFLVPYDVLVMGVRADFISLFFSCTYLQHKHAS